MVQGEGGSGVDFQLLGTPIHRKNYSHYNEATKNGNAETTLQNARRVAENGNFSELDRIQEENVSNRRGGIWSGVIEQRTNYSDYNSARNNGKEGDEFRYLDKDGRETETDRDYGEYYTSTDEAHKGRVPQTNLTPDELHSRVQAAYNRTEEAMSSPAIDVSTNEGGVQTVNEEENATPTEVKEEDGSIPTEQTEDGGEGTGDTSTSEWNPDEVVDLQDDDVVVLLHYTREHYPLVKIARVTEENGQRVYHEIGKEGKVIDAEKGNWHEMAEKKTVEDENGVEYLFIDFDGRVKRRGIPVMATNGQLESINQQNKPKASGLKGLTELKKTPNKNVVEEEKLSGMQTTLEEPLLKVNGATQTITLLDILHLRPYATEETKMVKDENGNDVQKKSTKVVSVLQQIAAKCEKMAIESKRAMETKYGKRTDAVVSQSTDEQNSRQTDTVVEHATALLQDFKQAYKKQLDAWNKLVRKNKIDQLIAEHIDKIDPELIEAYKALHEKIYRKAQDGNLSVEVPTRFDSSRFGNVDENIFRYTQMAAEIARQACDASGITDVEDVLDMAVLEETPWRMDAKEARRKAGGKTVEDIKKEILDSLNPDNIHSAEDILRIEQRVGKMKSLLEDRAFVDDFYQAVQVAEEIYDRTNEIEDMPTQKKSKTPERDTADEIKTTELALAAARKNGDNERVAKLEDRLAELRGEKAAAADVQAETETESEENTPKEKKAETPEERQKRYEQLRKQQDYFWEQKKKAHMEEDAAAEAQADEMIKRIDEELDKMDEEAEMQRGQSVMSNATPAQRFVTNVVLKALKNIKGITVHHATKADVERMLTRLDKGVEMMGNRVNKRMAEIAEHFKDKDLTPEQRVIVDVFSDAKDRKPITLTRADGSSISVVMQQGTEPHAGTKHSLFRHYNTQEGVFSVGDILTLQEVYESGIREESDKTVVYTLWKDGVRYRAVNDKRDGKEVIHDFYTNKKADSSKSSMAESQNTQSARTDELSTNSDAKVAKNSETAKSEGEIEPLTTSDGTVYGWSIGNEIWLTDEGMNPETPIHEYLHLFVKAMAQENGKVWQRVVKLCKKNTTLWNEVVNDPNYKYLQDIKDEAKRDSAIASEMLARYGGKRGAEPMNEKATQMEKEGHSFESDASAKLLVGRMKKALQEVYQWALDKLGIPHYHKSIDEVVDKGLYDLLSSSEIEIADFTEEEQEIVDRAKAEELEFIW